MRNWIVVLGSILGLIACAHSMPADDEKATNDTFDADIGIVNHTDRYVYSTVVAGSGGGHAHPMSAGVGSMCCVKLPRKWHPGIKVNVGWDMPEGTRHVLKSKMVEVEKYDEPGTLYLHFFSGDEIRIVVTDWVGASPHHPIAPPPGTMLNLPE